MKSELQVFYDDKHFINSNCPELISADFASCKSTMVYSYNDSTCTTQKQNRFCKDLLDGKISVWSYINVSPKLSFGGFMSYVIHFWHPSLTALFKPPSNWLMYPHHGHRTCNYEHIRSLILKASLPRPKIEMSGWVDFAQHVLNVCEGVYHNDHMITSVCILYHDTGSCFHPWYWTYWTASKYMVLRSYYEQRNKAYSLVT